MTEQVDIAVIAATGQIVAQLAKQYSESQVVSLIADVRKALTAPLVEIVPEPVKAEPAVPVRQSVKPDKVTCLHCGTVMQSLKRHIGTVHGQSPEEYRKTWGLPADHPIVAPNYSARRSQLAKDSGLGRK